MRLAVLKPGSRDRFNRFARVALTVGIATQASHVAAEARPAAEERVNGRAHRATRLGRDSSLCWPNRPLRSAGPIGWNAADDT